MAKEVTYSLRLPTRLLDKEKRDSAIGEVAKYIEEKTLEDVNNTRSPVTGSQFKLLKGEYRDFKKSKGGSGVPDLRLTGSMLNAFRVEANPRSVKAGIFGDAGAENLGKADNHNKFSRKSLNTPVPKRQFIPNRKTSGRGKQYRPDIRNGILDRLKSAAKKGVTKQQIRQALEELNGR